MLTQARLGPSIQALHNYIRNSQYSGFDPYDGLESGVFRALGLTRFKWTRIAATQLLKRLPINLRGPLRVPRQQNPKGVALCVSALMQMSAAMKEQSYAEEAQSLADWLLNHARSYGDGCLWGYPFDWQSRTFFAPRNSPNTVCTVFCAEALLDAYEQTGESVYLRAALSAAEALVSRFLVKTGNEQYFQYVQGVEVPVHNVNLLASALCARAGRLTNQAHLLAAAARGLSYSCRRQRADGSWTYGEAANQQWVDNFHTGFNLVAIARYTQRSGDAQFQSALNRGLEFWKRNFFRSDYSPKYFPNQDFPLDAHCAAQAIITPLECCPGDVTEMQQSLRSAEWAIQHMQLANGAFIFQIHRVYRNRISYLRWSQCWMFIALAMLQRAVLANESGTTQQQEKGRASVTRQETVSV